MAFHDVRLPLTISYGAQGGPERRTDVVTLGSGREERNARWSGSRRKFDVGYGIRSVDDLADLVEFFEDRRGRLHTFRFRDWSDWKSCKPKATPAATDQACVPATGDDETVVFQLAKTYGTVSPWVRTIGKPVAGTVLIALDGTPQVSGWSVNTSTGVVTFDTAPGDGVAVTAGFEFDVEVRFANDEIMAAIAAFEKGMVPDVPLVEVLS